ncbi:MAG: haloacid dehalogenase-like hydrolase, partial [Bacteroidetes bacterium]
GVENFFDNIKNDLKKISANSEIEFYIISSGISEIVKNTKISKYFSDIWACEFHFDNNNLIKFPKKIVSFTDKTRYIFQISKGMIGDKYAGKPYAVNLKVDASEYYVPIKNMIYIGDGMTDVPCFSLLQRFGGITIAVYDAQNTRAYGKAQNFKTEKRVDDLHNTDYSKNSPLYNFIFESIKKMI